MSKKQYYIFNSQTQTYEPAKVERRWWANLLWILFCSVLLCAAIVLIVYFFFGSPKEEMLKLENEKLQTQYNILLRRVDDAMVVLDDIKQRDDNLYRVIMQAEPIGDKVRNAGIDNAARYADLTRMSNGKLVATVTQDVDRLARNLYVQDNSFNELVDLARSQEDRMKHIPAIQPVADKDLRRLGSGFGWRVDPVFNIRNFHDGIDLTANTGSPVYASGDATVVFTGWRRGYGKTIELDHGYGYVTRYAHLNKIDVKTGQTVTRGKQIGQVGNTGKSTGSHLHYEVILRGRNVDPLNYFFMDITPEEYDRMIQEVSNQ
ncbi:MAG: M23 family metallopeptidase [Bacteroidaceae bacterium]|nr:M23 family metallopeptidase [Bacteroidaceae bacterium]